MEAAIFDVDGTLLDSMGVWEHLGERYLKALGKTPEPGLQEILKPMTMEQSCQYLRKRYALDKTPEEIEKCRTLAQSLGATLRVRAYIPD